MTKPVSEVVEELERLLEKATPGPWVPSKFGFQILTGDSWNSICTLKGNAEWEDGRGNYTPDYEWQKQEANAFLIAKAVSALPTLLAEIKRGWEELREIAELTQRRQLPLTMQINDIARAALEGKDNG